jgi:hypothetical protein
MTTVCENLEVTIQLSGLVTLHQTSTYESNQIVWHHSLELAMETHALFL